MRQKSDTDGKGNSALDRTIKQPTSPYFPIRVESIVTDLPLPYDIYLFVADRYTHFRKIGEVITSDRMKGLLEHHLKEIYVPSEQHNLYRESLRKMVQNEDLKPEIRGKFIKETAFTHITDLFTQPDVSKLASESVGLVEDMVNFITTDISAAVSLMGLSTHDYYTYNHCVNVSVYTISIAKRVIGEDKKLLMTAGLGGLLHDLGKREISQEIINKPGKLNDNEWVEMKKHPVHGKQILDNVSTVPEDSKRMVFEHHEHLDGTGYPRGITEENIAKLSRIAAIADVFDALTTKRSYKEAVTADEALGIMVKMAPGKFDTSIFKYFDRKIPAKQNLKEAPGSDACAPGFTLKKVA
jgi:putative nucleotidyltransferase with HDIG domain